MQYELSHKARNDVKAIIRYTLENFGLSQVEDYIDGLYYSFDLLTDNPKLGRVFDRKIRYYIYRSHYVFYEIRKDVIRIATIRNTQQKIPKNIV